MDNRKAVRRQRDSDPLAHLRRYLEQIEDAIVARDAMAVTSLLRKRTATHLPRDVREELLMISRLSRDSLRAPIRFLRFQYRMMQLAAGGEQLLTAQTELQLDPPHRFGAVRRRGPDEQRTAASDPKPSAHGEDDCDGAT